MESEQQIGPEMDRPGSPCWIDRKLRIDIGQCIKKYKIISKLGEGSSGVVYKVVDTTKMIECALKITKKKLTKNNYTKMMREWKVLKKISLLDSGNKIPIVKLEDRFQYKGSLCMVFPLMGKTIYDFMNRNIFGYAMNLREHIQHVGYQMLQALHFLHINGITHTDLRPENILFTSLDPEKK